MIKLARRPIFGLILTIGLALRLIQVDSIVLGWHSHRQADTYSVTSYLSQNPSSFFLPRYHDFSHLQSGLPNPTGLRLVELPLYNLLSLLLSQISSLSLLISSRLVSILASLGTGLLIYRFFTRQKDITGGLIGLGVFLFLPYSVFYSRSILPEMLSLFLGTASLYLFSKKPLFSALLLAVMLLVKPFFAICLLPSFAYLFFQKKFTFQNRLLIVILFAASLLPVLLWRQHISDYPQGIPDNGWLFNASTNPIFPQWVRGVNLSAINSLEAFRPHWWYWLYYQRLFLLILGGALALPYLLGLVVRHPLTGLNRALFFGTFLYFAIVAGGNLRHDYYQVFTLLQLGLSVGIGFSYLKTRLKPRLFRLTLVMLFSVSLYITYAKIHPNYLIYNSTQLELATIAQKILPPNSLVIAPNMGDTTFLYFLNRSGYPMEMENISHLLDIHRQDLYLITTDRNDYYARIARMGVSLYSGPKGFIVKIPYESK